MDPINTIIADRDKARSHKDANAEICFLALSENNMPSVRTLVLRDVQDTGFTLFINKTSAKWKAITSNDSAQILIWYPSIQRQYRVSGKILELPRSVVEQNWPNRPAGSKYLDMSYEQIADQSSSINSRQFLTDNIAQLQTALSEAQLTTPANATGIQLLPDSIECLDLNDPARIHERTLFTKGGGDWRLQTLMP